MDRRYCSLDGPVARNLIAAAAPRAVRLARAGLLSQPQHLAHSVEAGRAAWQPARRPQRATRKHGAIEGPMLQLDDFLVGGKQDAVIADHAARPQTGETDAAPFPRRANAVPRIHRPVPGSQPRPAAAASPSCKAVPDGASSLLR